MNARDKFLHPPPEGTIVPAELQDLVETAAREMEQAFPPSITAEIRNELLRTEAVHSAAIEDEFDPERVARHHRALSEFLDSPLSPASLLEMHRSMMKGQPHAEPGRYRSQRIVVGGREAPRPALVPSLMDELFTFLDGEKKKSPRNRIALATRVHVEFETVHPFSDGNGRTGRAIITHLLGAPLPLSRFIFAERPMYYRLFKLSDWARWLRWMAGGVILEARLRLGEERGTQSP